MKRMKTFIEVTPQNNYHCHDGFTNVGISLHMVPEWVLYPSSFHLFKMIALSVFFKVHHSRFMLKSCMASFVSFKYPDLSFPEIYIAGFL